MTNHISLLLRLAQSSSALGAGILGLGIGVWLSESFLNYKWVLILAGAVLHTIGMSVLMAKDEKLKSISSFWKVSFQILFWICLAFIVFLFIKVLVANL